MKEIFEMIKACRVKENPSSFLQKILTELKTWFPFLFLALRDASQPGGWLHGSDGGSDAWSFLWRREHGNAAWDGTSRHGCHQKTVPSSTAAATTRGTGRPKTGVKSLCERRSDWSEAMVDRQPGSKSRRALTTFSLILKFFIERWVARYYIYPPWEKFTPSSSSNIHKTTR